MRRLVATIALVAAVAGCSSSSDGPKQDELSLSPSTTTRAAAALGARIPRSVPDGFTATDDAPVAIDLDDAAAASNDETAERARLRRRGFVDGAVRTWVNAASGDTLYIAVYAFGDSAGAAGYGADQAAVIEGAGGIPFPAGGGWTTVEQDGDATLTTHAAVRQQGTLWALVLLASERADRTALEAVEIADGVRL